MQAHEVLLPALAPPADETAATIVYPRLAHAWARTLVMYWCRLERLGSLDLAQPMYVLDLAPGDGTLARGVLRTLEAELQARGMLGWLVRYVACTLGPAAREARWDDHELRQWADRGLLQQGSWPARTGSPLLLGGERVPLFGARNPVAALYAGSLPPRAEPARVSLLDALADFSAGRFLVLAADCGALRFEAFAWQEQEPGTRSATLHCAGCDLVLHVACRDDLVRLEDLAWDGLLKCADAGHPADRWLLAPPADAPAVTRFAWRLRQSGHDPAVLPGLLREALAEEPGALLAAGEGAVGDLKRELSLCRDELPPSDGGTQLREAVSDLLLRLDRRNPA